MSKSPPIISTADKKKKNPSSSSSSSSSSTTKKEFHVKSVFTLKDVLREKFLELGVDLKDISKIKQLISIWDRREMLDIIDELQMGTITKFSQSCDITVPTMSKFLDHLFTLDFPLNLEIFEARKNTNSMVYSVFNQLETTEYADYVRKYGRKLRSHVKQDLTLIEPLPKDEFNVKPNKTEKAIIAVDDLNIKQELREIIREKKRSIEMISDPLVKDAAKNKLTNAINRSYVVLRETNSSMKSKEAFFKELSK